MWSKLVPLRPTLQIIIAANNVVDKNIIKVLFIHQLMHQWVVLKSNITISYIKIYIKTAPKCLGVTVTPSSGSGLICAY